MRTVRRLSSPMSLITKLLCHRLLPWMTTEHRDMQEQRHLAQRLQRQLTSERGQASAADPAQRRSVHEDWEKSFGDNVRHWRRERNWSQEDLADKLRSEGIRPSSDVRRQDRTRHPATTGRRGSSHRDDLSSAAPCRIPGIATDRGAAVAAQPTERHDRFGTEPAQRHEGGHVPQCRAIRRSGGARPRACTHPEPDCAGRRAAPERPRTPTEEGEEDDTEA